ncbi:MAG: NAD-dependent epimerase/dehydratase family protein [Calditrichaeota bacterium]|nr:MAG: NAD-dependent epimerase/dehydratase family protein [Calditrichota bacterium]MBL1206747.1 NAD-dependent epimerase/dehydratase family protein [Calditrichota bacterium]NOG46573.1 NAD-dependent epimerase/dehydratase family protein [Calditrichota bacterium]
MGLVLVSGVNGFIGSHVAEKLLQEGHKVRGIVRKSSDLSLIEGLNIELVHGDITNRDSLKPAMENIEIVIHVAGLASDWDSYENFYDINVAGTKNMATCAEESNVKRFVHISTTAISGFKNKRDITEEEPITKSIFSYCETKREAELWLNEFKAKHKMEVAIIRPGNVYGPKDHTFIEKYLEALEQGKISFIDKGQHLTCPTYITNLVDGIILACFKPEAKGETFNITDGLEINWKIFTDKLAEQLGAKKVRLSVPFNLAYVLAFIMEIIYLFLKIKKAPLLTRYRICNGGKDYHFSIEKARKILGYNPDTNIDKSITDTVYWYKEKTTT